MTEEGQNGKNVDMNPLEIKSTEGALVRLPPEKIQFFWQKWDKHLSHPVTQIVYNTEEPLIFKDGSLAGEIPWKQGRVISGRAVVDTALSLDETLKRVREIQPIKFIIFRRSYTVDDNRVFFAYPSTTISSLIQHFAPIFATDATNENGINIRSKAIAEMLESRDGGGDGKGDYALHGISTYSDYRIYLVGHPSDMLATINCFRPYHSVARAE